MRLIGDVPEEFRELAAGLEDAERFYNSHSLQIPIVNLAKGFVCMAHDWYKMGCEEEGNRLLLKAEAVCPGYFQNVMINQTLEDKDFDYLVKGLTVELAWMLLYRLRHMEG